MARTILLADDSVTAQNMGRRILTDAGYEVITVNNGSAALKKIAEHKPDLIVLDVYMPGYGGLEVCNRLKEARETARIPVLLTVGKLEPFKPDEARRVRADAFLIKPFEASELLTALTKLEDKIVPQAQPHKPGRFAKALASIEATDAGEAFGDTETGWKDRLSIPHAPVKSRPPETPEEKAMKPADLGRGEDFKPAEARFDAPDPGRPACGHNSRRDCGDHGGCSDHQRQRRKACRLRGKCDQNRARRGGSSLCGASLIIRSCAFRSDGGGSARVRRVHGGNTNCDVGVIGSRTCGSGLDGKV